MPPASGSAYSTAYTFASSFDASTRVIRMGRGVGLVVYQNNVGLRRALKYDWAGTSNSKSSDGSVASRPPEREPPTTTRAGASSAAGAKSTRARDRATPRSGRVVGAVAGDGAAEVPS